MTAPVVVMHRPPLKRIDFGPRPASPVLPVVEHWTVTLERVIEHSRIWGLLRQSAEGCNQVEVVL